MFECLQAVFGGCVGDGDGNQNPWEGASKEDAKLEHPDFDTESVWTAYLDVGGDLTGQDKI